MELPEDKQKIDKNTQYLTHRAKALIKDLAHINLELAQMIVSSDDGTTVHFLPIDCKPSAKAKAVLA